MSDDFVSDDDYGIKTTGPVPKQEESKTEAVNHHLAKTNIAKEKAKVKRVQIFVKTNEAI